MFVNTANTILVLIIFGVVVYVLIDAIAVLSVGVFAKSLIVVFVKSSFGAIVGF